MDGATAQTILQQVREKTAQPVAAPLPSIADQRQGLVDSAANSKILNDAVMMAFGGLGIGAGARGVMGLMQLAQRARPRRDTRIHQTEIPLPFPARPMVEEKVANLLTAPAESTYWHQNPALILGGVGGLALGWKGLDHLLDRQRKGIADAEEQKAKQEFEQALLNSYPQSLKTVAPISKAAADDATLGQLLDLAFDRWQAKQANDVSLLNPGNLAGRLGNVYGGYATLAALTGGALSYDFFRKRQRRAILDKALAERNRRQFAARPPEILAVPTPVPPA